MKKSILLMLLLPSIIFSQYYGERTTEQSFESSSMYFNSHYMNTYGIYKFKDVSLGLIDDPFLNIYLNPAMVPQIGEKEFYIHLDFRGDRTKPAVMNNYIYPVYYDLSSFRWHPPFDSRWFTETRDEPEPVFSLGIIHFPFGKENKSFYVGGTYQLIYNEEKFYEMPYSIYSKNIYYDSFNSRAAEVNIPIEDRYSGKDEMLNEAHMITAFAGYKLSDKFSFGLMINSVIHTRDGSFVDIKNDEYGDTDNYDWSNSSITERDQNYDHFDVSAGVIYKPSDMISLGIKAGILRGNADQKFLSDNKYFSQSNQPDVSPTWYYYLSDFTKHQSWKQDGNTTYLGINSSKIFDGNSSVNWYYKYTFAEVTTDSRSEINDTSYNSGRWYDDYNKVYNYNRSSSALHDSRIGSGSRETTRHEFMLNLNWQLTEITKIMTGLYIKKEISSITNTEPALVNRNSDYYSEYNSDSRIYQNTLFESENKTLNWEYSANTWTIQIPVLLHFDFSKHWGMMLGVNRILNAWKIEDVTTAIFSNRTRIENGIKKEENNFGERYTQPDERLTEDYFDIINSFHINISDQLKVELIMDPEFENTFRIEQWWLSFKAGF
ncbi:MAG: hypothetical protein KKB34_02005 [Bacteroidetes bacterium]|nr:hypothetical protein [Bacteroidota bacterium]